MGQADREDSDGTRVAGLLDYILARDAKVLEALAEVDD